MKFSYRIVFLLFLSLIIAAVCVLWLATYSQRHVLAKVEPSRIYQTRKPQKEKPAAESESNSDVDELIVRNHTDGKSTARQTDTVWKKTTYNTFDILDDVDAAAGPEPQPTDKYVKTDAEFQRKKLKIIVVPHSHNDPGWVKTIDNYFEDQTKFILTNMVKKLTTYPKMTFIWAETVFLSMWWKNLDAASRKTVRKLIDRRQLEILSGGWILTDEANCHYSAIIDQTIEGHQWLRENIGSIPKTSWSLDPFGYSSLHPYLYKKMGYENAVILRVSESIKSRLQRNKGMEFYWRQVWDRGNDTDMFTLMMPYMLYNIKHSCGPDKEICLMFDFRQIPGEDSESRAIAVNAGNVDRQAKLLLNQYQKKADLYRHGVVLVPLGDDFRFDRSVEWDQQYKNYQMLFNYINRQQNWNVEIRFGIVQDYFDEVAKVVADSGKTPQDFFPSLSGDFFPYTDRDDEYWTGYFASRPFGKMLSRELEVFLRAAEILNTLCRGLKMNVAGESYNGGEMLAFLDVARKNLALYQHHDAIAGTSTMWVAQDYEGRLYRGLHLASSVISGTLTFLLTNAVRPSTPIAVRVLDPLYSRTLMSVQIVRLNDDRVKIIVLNSIARDRQELVQLSVDREDLEVNDSEGHKVVSQMTAAASKGQKSEGHFLLSFLVDLPALGISTYDVVKTESPHDVSEIKDFKNLDRTKEVIVIENEALQVNISAFRGQVASIGLKRDGIKISAYLKFLMYTSRRSGAYIFAPVIPADEKNFSRPLGISLVKGRVFSEVRIRHSCVTQILRLVKSSAAIGSALHLENIVDMTSGDFDDLELVMRLDSSVKSKDIFYTDQNGYHIMKRRRHPNLLLEANYYPSSSVAYVEDERLRLSVITAQPVGVTSLKQGSIEVMLDRRLKYDDGRGIGAGVMDNKVVLGRFYILPEKIFSVSQPDPEFIPSPSLLASTLIDSLRHYPIVATTNYRRTLPAVSLVKSPLPCDTILVNFRLLGNSSNQAALVLHKQATSAKVRSPGVETECKKTSSTVTISQMFHNFKVQRVFESSLSFLRRKDEIPLRKPLSLNALELYAYEVIFDVD